MRLPTDQEIREELLKRADTLRRRTGKSLSEIGREAVQDTAFMGRVRNGKNITLKVYQRALDWFDRQERRAAK